MTRLRLEHVLVARALEGGEWEDHSVDPKDEDRCRSELKQRCKKLKVDPSKHLLRVRKTDRDPWTDYRL